MLYLVSTACSHSSFFSIQNRTTHCPRYTLEQNNFLILPSIGDWEVGTGHERFFKKRFSRWSDYFHAPCYWKSNDVTCYKKEGDVYITCVGPLSSASSSEMDHFNHTCTESTRLLQFFFGQNLCGWENKSYMDD